MDTQQHRVLRQVLELRAPREDAAGELHRQLGRIQRQYLESIIDECCSEVSSPDRLHRIDNLELDLGSFSFAELEAELPRSLQKAMRQALRGQIQTLDKKANAGDGHPAARSQLELVAFFAMNGALPWWADSRRPRHLPESIEFLLSHAPDDLASLLSDILRYPEPSLRIVLHCDDGLLLRVFDALSPSAASAAAIRQQLNVVLGGPWLKATPALAQARNALWIATLTHASYANAPPSWQPATGATASPFWLSVFYSLTTRSPEAFAALLAAFAQHVRSADPRVGHAVVPVSRALVEVGRRYGQISDVVLTEIADWWQATESSTDTPPDRISVLDRMNARAVEVDEEMAGELEKSELGTTHSAEQAFRRDKARQQTLGEDRAQAAPGKSHLDEGHAQAAPVLPPALVERRSSHDSRPLDLRFADADSVYIENAGLVILWPFLERFFDRLQLLHERKFVDVAAQHRAAGLLQYVATEDPSPPEYQMLLNKMLCGMGPDDLLDFGPEVTEVETQECVSLLSAVIENAPVLRNMSHEGFRGSFLLRKGALSAGDGSWLLRVERETFDIVLDRFPWSFNWIKLGWMDVPLAVEW